MSSGPVVDTPSAQEFSHEILDRIPAWELRAIADALDRKSRALREVLLPAGQGAPLDRDALRGVLRWIFAARNGSPPRSPTCCSRPTGS